MKTAEVVEVSHAKHERLARELAASGLVGIVCERLQAQLVQQWLSSETAADREKCWHEVRAVEFARVELASELASPEAQPDVFDALVDSQSTWERWLRPIADFFGRAKP